MIEFVAFYPYINYATMFCKLIENVCHVKEKQSNQLARWKFFSLCFKWIEMFGIVCVCELCLFLLLAKWYNFGD